MFYSVELLSLRKKKKGRLPFCWLAATVKNYHRQLSKEEINSVQVDLACEDIIEGLIGHDGVPRLSLYLSAQLSFGVVKIFQDQVNDLYDETLQLLSIPSPEKKKSKKTKAVKVKKDEEVENLDINLPEDDETQKVLDYQLPDLDIEKLFEGHDQRDRHQLIEIDEYEVNDEASRLPPLGIINNIPTPRPGADIEEFIHDFPTVEYSPIKAGVMDQRAPTPPAMPKRKSQEVGDNIEQRTPEPVVEDPSATPKRKSRRQHDETPSKRKRISTTETARSPSHRPVRRSLLSNLIGSESTQANAAQTDNLDLPMNDSSEQAQMPENNQRFSPPTESTGTQQMANRENLGEVMANPIIEISEVSTIAADEPVDYAPGGFLRPEQPVIASGPLTATSAAPEDQVQDNQQAIDGPPIQQPTIDQESEFVLPELDNASVTSSVSRRRRKVFSDKNKQIKMKYRSDSNALDHIYTWGNFRESCLPDARGKDPANSLLSLPSVGLKIGLRGNRSTCPWSAKLLDLFLNNIEKPCTNEFDLDQLPRRDDFVNKRQRGSRIQGRESSVESRSRTQAAISPRSPSHSQRQIDQQLMPPPSAPVSLVHSREHPSPRPSRGFPEPIEPALAVSPRPARQRSQPSTIEPDVPQADAALPTGESVQPLEVDQAGQPVEAEPLHEDMPMPINDPVQPPEIDQVGIEAETLHVDIPMPIDEPVHRSQVDEVQTETPYAPAAISDESFLAGVRWQRLTESAQNETEDARSQSSHEILIITRDEFHELLRKLWEVMMEFGEPPRLSFDDVFTKGQISVLEVLRYFKYLFEFEQKRILCIEEESPYENYICKLEELEDDEN